MASWHRLLTAGGTLCVLLLAVSGAFEIYDDISARFEPDFIYQDGSYSDMGPLINSRYDDPANDFMLYKLLKNMQGNEIPYSRPFYKSNYIFENNNPFGVELMKEPVKRLTHDLTKVSNSHKVTKPPVKPQQKWKIKKGKTVGSQMVCYFKLCAFRAP